MVAGAAPAGATLYFVNDASTNGDVYCTNVGSDGNPGTNAAAPKLTMTNLFASVTLLPGDIVYIDTGGYSNYTVNVPASGTAGNLITFQGSTNYGSGGTVFRQNNSASNVFSLAGRSYISLRDLTVRDGQCGVYMTGSFCDFYRVAAIRNARGFWSQSGGVNAMRYCVMAENSIGLSGFDSSSFNQGVLWSNTTSISTYSSSSISLSNSVIVGGIAFTLLPDAAEYNVYWRTDMSSNTVPSVRSLSEVQEAKGHSFRSIVADPQFGDPAGYDFHPRSVTGRYVQATKTWTTDAVHSVLIDFGNPASSYANEPAPNGSNMNAGAWGNTAEASKSRTNAWLLAVSFNDGGTLFQTGRLYWTAGNIPTTEKVRLDYSRDNKATWRPIATNVAVTNLYYAWDASAVTSGAVVYWRVARETNTNFFDVSDTNFALRGLSAVPYYVNDTGTWGDVYTHFPGASTNDGLTPDTPKDSIQGILDAYSLSGDHTIYVDTGYYTGQTVTVTTPDSGWSNRFMTIQGSTNYLYGGTVLNRGSAASDVVILSSVRRVKLRDLALLNGRYGLFSSSSMDCEYEQLTARFNDTGFRGSSGNNHVFRRCAAAQNTTGAAGFNLSVLWDYGVSWSNTTAFAPTVPAAWSVSNSVIVGGTAFSGAAAPGGGDYNLFWSAAIHASYASLSALQKGANGWWNCAYREPFFVDPTSADFHPQSTVNTYSNGAWVKYTNHSACIDLGDPAASYALEYWPHGTNVNLGIYGNTAEASQSRTNAWLMALNYNDGGVLNAQLAERVYWKFGVLSTTNRVRIELSRDGGATWVVAGSNILASIGYWDWANTNFASTRLARWRVVLEANTNVFSSTTYTNFTFQNGRYEYYLNDENITNDVYCNAPGSDTNTGTSAGSPKYSLKSLVDAHEIQPGDIIYYDTGLYHYSVDQAVSSLDTGVSNLPVTIQGSTNWAAGGTVIERRTGTYGLDLSGAAYYRIENLTITNAQAGVRIQGTNGVRLVRVSVKRSVNAFEVSSAADVVLEHCIAADNTGNGLLVSGAGSSVQFIRGVCWQNQGAAVRATGGRVAVSNTAIVVSHATAYGYHAATATNILGDYNALHVESNGVAAYLTSLSRNLDTLDAWSAETGQERQSLRADPLFVNPFYGDFHLQTDQRDGRWITGVGWYPGWDAQSSPLIDAGDPLGSYSNELAYNGARINIGRYGNTAEASRGGMSNRLYAASLRQGGWVRGTSTLHWVVGGAATSHFVKIEFSADGGATWLTLTNRIAAAAESFAWNTWAVTNTPAGLWRVTSTNTPALFDQPTNFFAVRNASLSVYVNDASTNGDVYASAVGGPTNWPATAARPLNSLARALSAFDLEPGDTVFVDTGVYTNSEDTVFLRRHNGSGTQPLLVLGSTNDAAGGTVLFRAGDGASVNNVRFDYAQFVILSNLSFRGGRTGVRINGSGQVQLSRVNVSACASNGVEVLSSTNILLSRLAAYNNPGYGLNVIVANGIQCFQSVLWSNAAGAVRVVGSGVQITNSVLEASGEGVYVYMLASNAVLRSDYNDVLARNGAFPAQDGFYVYKNMSRWKDRTTNDIRSLTHDPLFVDAASGDFHVLSQAGRCNPTSLTFVADSTNSPLIDTGPTDWPYAAETGTNGYRVNLGLYGNHGQASRSRTNGWLLALTLNDGGSIRGTGTIYWVAGGVTTGQQITIDFSWDAGVNWTNIATNVAASAGNIPWATDRVRATSQGVLRYRSQPDPSVEAMTEKLFSINNTSLTFYVNDAYTNGDVYTSAPGQTNYDGLTEDYPADSILTILRRYDPQPGDRFLVDNGTYVMPSPVTIDSSTMGSLTNLVLFQGSTNQAAGGTVLDFSGQTYGFSIENTEGINLRHLRIQNARSGVRLRVVTNCFIESVWVRGGGHGFEIEGCRNVELTRCAAVGAATSGVYNILSTNTIWRNGVLWSNAIGVLLVNVSAVPTPPANYVIFSNSVVGAFGTSAVAYTINGGVLLADYNDLHLADGARMARSARVPFEVLSEGVARWRTWSTQDLNSVTGDPALCDPGAMDFHPLSRGGRYSPPVKDFVTTDTVTSILIDVGPTNTADLANESSPNGARVNIGMYGGTVEASRTPTNSFLGVISLSDGGVASGTNFPLRWIARGNATGHLVRLDFSWNYGTNWQTIVTNWPARTGTYTWNTTGFTSTLFGLWMVSDEAELGLASMSAQPFALRNTNFIFYVNDTGTAGDVYCSAAGAEGQSGRSTNAPMLSIQRVLDAYDLEGGDILYVDTGVYTGEDARATVTQLDTAPPGGDTLLYLRGSTNAVAGGSVLDGAAGVVGLNIQEAYGVDARDFTVQNVVSSAVRVAQSGLCTLYNVQARGAEVGFDLQRSMDSLMVQCASVGADTGLRNLYATNTVLQNCVLWSNRLAVSLGTYAGAAMRNGVVVSNSVMGLFGAQRFAYEGETAALQADYNDLYLQGGAYAARKPGVTFSETIDTLSRWVAQAGQDRHSLSHHPGFAQDGLDFHPKSAAGRWSSTNYVFTDVTNSILLDAGAPGTNYFNEPPPNGSRLNIGPYGNTTQASLSPTNARLTVVSLNDGGRAVGTNQFLYWVASGDATGHTVKISYSGDGGATWTTLVSGVSALASNYLWDTTTWPSTLLGMWEVRSQTDTNIFGRNSTVFSVRNEPMRFYVNDANTNYDVYCTAAGQSTNNGLFAHTPKTSLQSLLDSWDLEPGDIVYVDTGVYTSFTGITVGQLDAGEYSNQVRTVIQGSTNDTAGGSVLAFVSTAAGISLEQAEAMELRNLTIRGAQTGVTLSQARRSLLEWLRIEGGTIGFSLANADGTILRHCLVRDATLAGVYNTSADISWENGVLWSNRFGTYLAGGMLSFRDSVVAVFGTNATAYYISSYGVLAADYNALYLNEGALAGLMPRSTPWPDEYFSVAGWAAGTSNDTHSLSGDPLFVDVAGGDFRLKSVAGHYSPAITGYVADAATSPLVDAGDPAASWTNEPLANGARRNMGMYGHSGQASQTPTNASLTVLSFDDGGYAAGIIPLYWLARGDATSHTARLRYSSDGGAHWQYIATNVAAGAGVYYWDSATFTSSIRGVWWIQSELDSSLQDTNRVLFALRNEALQFYVDDASTNGNVYCSAPGNPSHTGTTPADPLDKVQSVLDRWDLEPGDWIYVDTGEYLLTDRIEWDRFDAWQNTNLVLLAQDLEGKQVVLQGSTNEPAGGSRLIRVNDNDYLIYLNTAPGVLLRNLTLRNGSAVLRTDSAAYGGAEWVRFEDGRIGVDLHDTRAFEMEHCVSRNHAAQGLSVVSSEGTVWRSGVIWSNQIGAYQYQESGRHSSLTMEHTVIGAFGEQSYALNHISGSWTSDYNNIYVAEGAWPAGMAAWPSPAARTNRLEAFFYWTREMKTDYHTLTEEPGFVNAAAGDFHLQTTWPGGRYDPILGTWTNDAGFSRIIDAGNPLADFSNEPSPNGRRIDIGLYGNTTQASKTPTNAWVNLITLHDGGSVQGSLWLYWVAGGSATGFSMYLDFAHVSGIDSWTNIATNAAAALGAREWNSTGYGKSAAGEVRIVAGEDRSVNATSAPVSLRDETGSIWYFVNNAETNGDVYTSVPGKSSYPGTTPYLPKASIQDVINTYKLEPVDVVFIDTGEYKLTADILINDLDTGSGTNFVTFRGSTNWAAGGTVINRNVSVGTVVMKLRQVSGIRLQDLTLRGAEVGLEVRYSDSCLFDNVRSRNNGATGFQLSESDGIQFRRCIAWNNGGTNGTGIASDQSSMSWSNSLLWANATGVQLMKAGTHYFRNSVLYAFGAGRRIFDLDTETSLSNVDSDYNNFILGSGATIAEKDQVYGGSDLYGTLIDWQTRTGIDPHSLSHEPQFADTVNGDFRVKSQAGRFRLNGTLTNDTVNSPLIDTGDPATTWTNEPDPNGSRVNIGPDGNWSFASLSRTNPWLLAVSLNAGGTIRGTNTLRWTSGNIATDALVRLEYSRNGGVEWRSIASNIVNGVTGYAWNVSAETTTVQAAWRVIYQADTNVWDRSDVDFIIKNGTVNIYVNDDSTNGDVYCRGLTALGNDGQSGLTNTQPMRTPSYAIARYALGPGDTVYIDTGTYNMNSNLYLGELNRGTEAEPIRVFGSTNWAAGGTLLNRGNAFEPGIRLQNTHYIELHDLRIMDALDGIEIDNVINAALERIEVFKSKNGISTRTLRDGRLDQCVLWNNRNWGLTASSQGALSFQRGVFWSNRTGAVQLESSSLSISNTIIHGQGTSQLYQVSEAVPKSDFNILWKEENAILARDTFNKVTYPNLQSWQRNMGVDEHSVLLNPGLFMPTNGDFHLMSDVVSGRYDRVTGRWTNDATSSWAIDAGHPSAPYVNETNPNGTRMNAGNFGNTWEASRSSTNRALLATSFNDGGLVSGNDVLYWLSRGLSASDLVRIEFSRNNGLEWLVVASNRPATEAGYEWDTSTYPSTPLALWRVVLQSDTSIVDVVDRTFILRNGPIMYYVNDASTNGDVYTRVPGSAAYDGLSTNTPMNTLQGILNYDLESGDTVWVDTGRYTNYSAIEINTLHSGASTARVSIVGSTNVAAGGSVLIWDYSECCPGNGITFRNASWIELSDLEIRDAATGLQFEQYSGNNLIRNVQIYNAEDYGVYVSLSSGNQFRNLLVAGRTGRGFGISSSPSIYVDGSVIWGNSDSAIEAGTTALYLTNSVLFASSSSNYCLRLFTNTTVTADYNCYFSTNLAPCAYYNGVVYDTLLRWTEASAQDVHSLNEDPLFADATNFDFHPRSVIGRYQRGVGWTNDADHSPLIDAGAPNWPFDLEHDPNGDRANIGLYGGTAEASKSRTNEWLKALTGSSGGRVSGLFYLAWAGWTFAPTNTVRLDYSYDNGGNWTTVVEHVLLTNWSYLWNSADAALSPISRWRVVLESNTNIWDINDFFFGLNGPFKFYVNDTDTNRTNDVYTTAIGSDTNFGLYPHIPKATLNSVLSTYDLEGGDAVWMDSGEYVITTNNPIVWPAGDSGSPGYPVLLWGNTNKPLTILRGQWAPSPVLANLTFQANDVRVAGLNCQDGHLSANGIRLVFEDMGFSNGWFLMNGGAQTARTVRVTAGSVFASGTGIGLHRFAIRDGNVTGVGTNVDLINSLVTGGSNPAVSVSGDGLLVRNNTLVGAGTQLRKAGTGNVVIENNIISASGLDRFCILLENGTMESDYNNLYAVSNAWIGNDDGYWERLIYWQRESGQDLHSVATDPYFADATNGDYHLRSAANRWTGDGWTNDAVHSPCIDAGNPESVSTNEHLPNGYRVNLGAYGNTEEASWSVTNAWLRALTMNDGGVLKGTNIIRWTSGYLGAGDLVRLEYSTNNFVSSYTIVAGLSATEGQYIWDTTLVPSSLSAWWRVVLETNTAVEGRTEQPFAVRNTPLPFYVNDASTNNDVYTLQPGSASNDGQSQITPKDSVKGILDTYDTEPGDLIYVDTGSYTSSVDTRIIWSRGGEPLRGSVTIQGSTNYAAGGSVLRRSSLPGTMLFDVKASYVSFRDLALEGAHRGLFLESNRFCSLERLMLRSNNYGVVLYGTVGMTNRNLGFSNNRLGGMDILSTRTTLVEFCTFAGNSNFSLRLSGSVADTLQNNIYYVNTISTTNYSGESNVLRNAFIDYNVYHFVTQVVVRAVTNILPVPPDSAITNIIVSTNIEPLCIYGSYSNLQVWQLAEAHDYRSAITNPRLAGADSGDFHLLSTTGRYVAGWGWTNDSADSWALDKANPASSWTNEPWPNGARANLGMHGNTEQASKSGVATVTVVRTFNQPVFVSETNKDMLLIWNVRYVPTDTVMRVQYSGDYGTNWMTILASVNAYQEYFLWTNITPYYNTFKGKWRVVGVFETNYWDMNDDIFSIFYGEFAFSKIRRHPTLTEVTWRGAWAEPYQVQFATNTTPTTNVLAAVPYTITVGTNVLIRTNIWREVLLNWTNAPSGAGTNEQAYFVSPNGGDLLYVDPTSTNPSYRLYRVINVRGP